MIPAFLVRSRGLGKLYNRLFLPLLDRYGLTQAEADILLFLASDESRAITGQAIVSDFGSTL